jgi:hypothetical protein
MSDNIAQAVAFGNREILWSLNFLGFYDATTPITAADIEVYGDPYAEEAYSMGCGGWKYALSFMTQARVDALTEVRNRQAANWP